LEFVFLQLNIKEVSIVPLLLEDVHFSFVAPQVPEAHEVAGYIIILAFRFVYPVLFVLFAIIGGKF